ncbi:MAG: ECF transporter S component [Oscillospiraceae bacterium]
MKNNKFTVQDLAKIGVMAALIFVTTKFISIPIPTPLGKTAIHFGNVMCILGGLLFGALPGGLAAGIGSCIVDLMDPSWAPEFWITFINKFIMGFVAGLVMKFGKPSYIKTVTAAVAGAVSYVAAYLAKTLIMQYYILGNPWQTVSGVLITKGTVSLVNGLIAMVVSVIFYSIIAPALKKAGLFQEHKPDKKIKV